MVSFQPFTDEDLLDSMIAGRDLLSEAQCQHPLLLKFIDTCLQNTYLAKAHRKPSKYTHRLTVHDTSMRFLAGWLDRLTNMHEKPIALIRFSMNMYFCRTPVSIWNQLSILRFAISRTTTMELYKIGMTIPVYTRLRWPQHATTCILGADNMTYVTYMHTPLMKDNGKLSFSHTYNTLNIWEKFPTVPIANYDEENRKPLPDITASNVERFVDSIVFDKTKAEKWQNSSWQHAVETITDDRHLHAYPNVNPPLVTPPNIHVHTPLHNVSTQSYKDIKVLLEWILHNKIRIDKYLLVVLFGDEQLICRIWHLLGIQGNIWGDLIPFPGDLHFKMHCALGIMRVGEDYLIPLAKELGYASINKKDFKLEDWSQHDSFLMVVGEAAVVWLHNLLPNKMKQLPFDEIMSKISTNKHVSFLYGVVVVNIFDSYHATSFVTLIGLLCTYAELRYAVRENNIQRVDKIWRAFLPVFRATNKTHYAFLSIYTRFVVKHAH